MRAAFFPSPSAKLKNLKHFPLLLPSAGIRNSIQDSRIKTFSGVGLSSLSLHFCNFAELRVSRPLSQGLPHPIPERAAVEQGARVQREVEEGLRRRRRRQQHLLPKRRGGGVLDGARDRCAKSSTRTLSSELRLLFQNLGSEFGTKIILSCDHFIFFRILWGGVLFVLCSSPSDRIP